MDCYATLVAITSHQLLVRVDLNGNVVVRLRDPPLPKSTQEQTARISLQHQGSTGRRCLDTILRRSTKIRAVVEAALFLMSPRALQPPQPIFADGIWRNIIASDGSIPRSQYPMVRPSKHRYTAAAFRPPICNESRQDAAIWSIVLPRSPPPRLLLFPTEI